MRFSFKVKIFIFIFLIIIFFLLLNLTFLGKEVKNFFYLISSPIQKFIWRSTSKMANFFDGILEIKNLKKEKEELELKVQELLRENTELKEFKKENETLREILDLKKESNFEFFLVNVIAKDISQDYLIINKGAKDNLKEGLPVINQQKFLVGKIVNVYDNFSKVQMITSKNSVFDIKIAGKDIYGLAKGVGNFKISIERIPKEKEVEKGDVVITSSMGGLFPEGLLIGEIDEVKKSDIEPFLTIKIKLPYETKDLFSLLVIKNFNPFQK